MKRSHCRARKSFGVHIDWSGIRGELYPGGRTIEDRDRWTDDMVIELELP